MLRPSRYRCPDGEQFSAWPLTWQTPAANSTRKAPDVLPNDIILWLITSPSPGELGLLGGSQPNRAYGRSGLKYCGARCALPAVRHELRPMSLSSGAVASMP